MDRKHALSRFFRYAGSELPPFTGDDTLPGGVVFAQRPDLSRRKMACLMLERDAPEAFRLYMRAISKNAGKEEVRAWANAALYRKWPVNANDFWFGKAKEAQEP